MLRALNPPEQRPPRPSAYRVPWVVERVFDSHALVTNEDDVAAELVRVFTHSRIAEPVTEHWGRMLPGETLELCLCELDPDEAVVTIAWFRPDDGAEYIWRFVA